jgi:GT2 family glycosyltransferase
MSPELKDLLESIEAQDGNVAMEVFVVANPPCPSLERYLKSAHHKVTYLSSEAVGANTARNLGVERAKGETILFIDDDCFLQDRKFVEKHVQAHRSYPEAAAIGGPYLLLPTSSVVAKAYHEEQVLWVRQGVSGRDGARHLLGGNCSFKSSVFKEDGFRFDEELRFGGTETELFFRLRQAERKLMYLAGLRIEHRLKMSLRSLIKKSFLQGVGAAYMLRKFESQCEQWQARQFFLNHHQSVALRFCQFVYRLSHHAGRKYFEVSRRSTASSTRIYFEVMAYGVFKSLPAQISSVYKGMRAQFFVAKELIKDSAKKRSRLD